MDINSLKGDGLDAAAFVVALASSCSLVPSLLPACLHLAQKRKHARLTYAQCAAKMRRGKRQLVDIDSLKGDGLDLIFAFHVCIAICAPEARPAVQTQPAATHQAALQPLVCSQPR